MTLVGDLDWTEVIVLLQDGAMIAVFRVVVKEEPGVREIGRI